MKISYKKRTGIVLSVLTALTLLAMSSCTDTEISSTRNTDGIKIDGANDDWQGNVTYIDNKDLAIGAANNDSMLYIQLYTADKRLQHQILFLGLSMYAKVPSCKDTIFGLRFPLKIMPGRFLRREPGSAGPDISEEQLEERNRAMEIIGPRKDQEHYMLVMQAQEKGINATLGIDKGQLILEMKVPLMVNQNYPYGVRLNGATELILHFETPQISMDDVHKQMGGGRGGMPPRGGMSGGMPPGGEMGRGMPPGGGKGGGPGRGDHGGMGAPSMLEPLKLEVKLLLNAK